jgi:hypothetical protein
VGKNWPSREFWSLMRRRVGASFKRDSPIFVDQGFAAVPAKIETVPDGESPLLRLMRIIHVDIG